MSAISDARKLANYNNKMERENTKLQYQYNRSLAQEDRAWQERMANSAHQREIKDLKAAGLNPVLSVTGGNGAATPSGSSTSVSKPDVDMSLPRAVMDMAMAQLNSATNLQIAAMNNSTQRYLHDTPGANSIPGLIRYLVGNPEATELIGSLTGLTPSGGSNGSSGSSSLSPSAKVVADTKPWYYHLTKKSRADNPVVGASKSGQPLTEMEKAIYKNEATVRFYESNPPKSVSARLKYYRAKKLRERYAYYYPEAYDHIIELYY